MASAVIIETVQLEEVRDLGWPTDRYLVWSFRKTLQRGVHFSPIQFIAFGHQMPPRSATHPAEPRVNPPPPSGQPYPAIAYQLVHEAFPTWLHAIQEFTAHYGRAWLHWDLAQRDIAQLRAILLSE